MIRQPCITAWLFLPLLLWLSPLFAETSLTPEYWQPAVEVDIEKCSGGQNYVRYIYDELVGPNKVAQNLIRLHQEDIVTEFRNSLVYKLRSYHQGCIRYVVASLVAGLMHDDDIQRARNAGKALLGNSLFPEFMLSGDWLVSFGVGVPEVFTSCLARSQAGLSGICERLFEQYLANHPGVAFFLIGEDDDLAILIANSDERPLLATAAVALLSHQPARGSRRLADLIDAYVRGPQRSNRQLRDAIVLIWHDQDIPQAERRLIIDSLVTIASSQQEGFHRGITRKAALRLLGNIGPLSEEVLMKVAYVAIDTNYEEEAQLVLANNRRSLLPIVQQLLVAIKDVQLTPTQQYRAFELVAWFYRSVSSTHQAIADAIPDILRNTSSDAKLAVEMLRLVATMSYSTPKVIFDEQWLAGYLDHEDKEVRRTALSALGRYNNLGDRTIDKVVDLCLDPKKYETQGYARAVLQQLLAAYEIDVNEIINILERNLDKDDSEAAAQVLQTVARVRSELIVPHLTRLVTLLETLPDKNIRVEIVEIFSELDELVAPVIDNLADLAVAENDATVRGAIDGVLMNTCYYLDEPPLKAIDRLVDASIWDTDVSGSYFGGCSYSRFGNRCAAAESLERLRKKNSRYAAAIRAATERSFSSGNPAKRIEVDFPTSFEGVTLVSEHRGPQYPEMCSVIDSLFVHFRRWMAPNFHIKPHGNIPAESFRQAVVRLQMLFVIKALPYCRVCDRPQIKKAIGDLFSFYRDEVDTTPVMRQDLPWAWSQADIYSRGHDLLLQRELIFRREMMLSVPEGAPSLSFSRIDQQNEIANHELLKEARWEKMHGAWGSGYTTHAYAVTLLAQTIAKSENVDWLEQVVQNAPHQLYLPYYPIVEHAWKGIQSVDRCYGVNSSVPAILALERYLGEPYRKLLESAVNFWMGCRWELARQLPRNFTHVGEDGLTPYYFYTSLPYVAAAIQKMLKSGWEVDGVTLRRHKNELIEMIAMLVEKNEGTFFPQGGTQVDATLYASSESYVNPYGGIAALTFAEGCNGYSDDLGDILSAPFSM